MKSSFNTQLANWLLDPDGASSPIEDAEVLKKKLFKEDLMKVYEEVELPLVQVLKDVEAVGVFIDTKALQTLSRGLERQLTVLVKKIYKEAGEEFNINSPKQLLDIFSRKLKLHLRSTNVDKIAQFKDKHPLVGLVLQYRELAKVRSTYVEPLLTLTDKGSRIHTTFIQTGTATGRLSSRNPNLQNLPKESQWADDVRRAFIASPGYTLVSFDYSQVQLRILATVARDSRLIEAFQNGEDIHKLTASRIFNVSLEKVTPQMRRVAKTLNFGIVYGMGPRALSRESGLSFIEAQNFIDSYFLEFSKVKQWQEDLTQEVSSKGYVTNLAGRKRYFTEPINFRAAINTPIQGLEADILKRAMIQIHDVFSRRKEWQTKVRLLLPVHDELLFEIQNDTIQEAVPLLTTLMESAYTLAVPVKVDVKMGKNWATLTPYKKKA
ncbi:MAG: hypothetical protein A3F24_00915 [Candidatus Colwellbacteria bacterium RIFCSPHIGHO2_12_FULL_44_17]|uniref:DNA-directed DNA polymerase n=1 Tax=Candidatus Colwellbacteria bacterium RIFCSPHIGHO2_12_FULL_44_17 TaxID=1797689 RepID=A0A1G1Z530_9BACT|nr:MAG: hypothetical protein A3F24_00915 [Candidatus Colwellbacteria bacterium RIFCSPHIGHO2_12_FULL_44_17]